MRPLRFRRSPTRRGFTLIETFVAMGMVAVLGGAFLTVVIMTMRDEAQERLNSTLRQGGHAVIRSMIRDAQVASNVKVAGGVSETTGTQKLVMRTTHGQGESGKIVYYRSGAHLIRESTPDESSSPTMQVLAESVVDWRIEPASDRLLRVRLKLAIDRYTRIFAREYEFIVRDGTGG